MRALEYVVKPADDGRRLSRVARAGMGLSAHQLARMKLTGGLLVDGAPARFNSAVSVGQTIRALLPEDACAPNRADMDSEPVNIVYEDCDLLVIDKPAPLATQSSSKQPRNTLENRLSYYFRDDPAFVFRPVNRLDKGTSGLMLVAKHAHAQWALTRILHTGDFIRRYLAIAVGAPPDVSGVIDAPIAKREGATVMREVNSAGKPSVTEYTVLKTLNGLSLIRLTLNTGRTHQIRVHLKHAGCPVFGDFLYGEERADILPGRFALHSEYISFLHPISGARMCFTSPLPPELDSLINS